MKTELVQHYGIDKDGKAILVKQEYVEVEGPTIEDKEAELLAIYNEIQALKAASAE